MRFNKRVFLPLFLIGVVLVAFSPSIATAAFRVGASDDLEDLQEDFQGLIEEEQRLRQKLEEVGQEKVSLENQVEYIDGSIQLTTVEINRLQYQIAEKEKELGALETDIGTLEERINRLGEALDYQTAIFKSRATASYKALRLTPLEIFLTSGTPGELLSYAKYLQRFETQDRYLLWEMRDISKVYNNQKDLLQAKKQQVEDVKEDIELSKGSMVQKKDSLSGQKQAKSDLLEVTKSDEAIYQRQLEAILAEQQAIESAISRFTSSLINNGVPDGSEVKRGDVIAVQGSTGQSTGDHVHFAVYVPCGDNWCHTNPQSYIDSGRLKWPLASFEISQEYGETEFARTSGFYANNFHNGIDIYGPIGCSVLAPADGVAVYSQDSVGGKGVLVYHDEALMSLMWHIR